MAATPLSTLAQRLGHLARLALERVDARGGRRLILRVETSGALVLTTPVDLEVGTSRALTAALDAAGSWVAGRDSLTLTLRPGERLQSPDVLVALRAAASDVPSVDFVMELPAGLRDLPRRREAPPR